ncbi:MAG: hypothetical protein HRT90_11290 [Candidatus Margulisbacteria bacterium]|nr:hypothetical protein [Candidatus Margulisiibacteriota bacterium]
MSITKEYEIELMENKVKVSGVLRLLSPKEYEEPFRQVKDHMAECKGEYVVDVSELTFLNSSGVTAIAQIAIEARQRDLPLKICGSDQIPWQNKTLTSLSKLWDKITVVFVSTS